MKTSFIKPSNKTINKSSGFLSLLTLATVAIAIFVPFGGLSFLNSLTRNPNQVNQPTTSRIADNAFSVQPIVFFPTDYPVDNAVVNHINQKMDEIRTYYGKQLNGKTFVLQPVKTVIGKKDSEWYWCSNGETECIQKDGMGNILQEIGRPQFGTINIVAFMGGGGYAGANGELATAVIGDVSIYPELDKNCNRIKKYYYKNDPINSVDRCTSEKMPTSRQGTGAIAHELGHTFGLSHPNEIGYPVNSPEYKNSIMGDQGVFPGGNFNLREKETLKKSAYFEGEGNNFQQNPGTGKSSTTVICKEKNGVNTDSYPNGYYGPICMTTQPTNENYKLGLFTDQKAKSTPNPYATGKYYDVYLCADKTYDFTPKNGLMKICNKFPWVQDNSGTLPQPPQGQTCKDPTPYWDGAKCTFRPSACNNIGPSGKVNTCQATACGTGFKPDTNATQQEANLACANAYGSSRSVCCLENTGNNNSPPKNDDQKKENPPPGNNTGENGNNSDNQIGQSCTTQGSSCGGSSDNACYPGWKDANNSSNQTYCCRFTERYCEAQGKCMANKSSCVAPSSGGGGNTGGSGRENDHCYNGNSDCAPEFKCTSSTGTATSYCVYKDPSESGAYCNTSSYHCESGNTCKSGTLASPLGHNYSCQKSGKGNICCTGTSGSTASTNSEVNVTSCTRNNQCLQMKTGTACVFTNNPGAGVCI
ncbi:MAG: hypothetical protein KBC00_01765 [Candidatus Levybacteria bacterium]|nr:hypothetical protein [Candidatus Levybacteria bacterium]MBP9815049.1 hypothetical protein [Candidatus Levybacteria bacterium]